MVENSFLEGGEMMRYFLLLVAGVALIGCGGEGEGKDGDGKVEVLSKAQENRVATVMSEVKSWSIGMDSVSSKMSPSTSRPLSIRFGLNSKASISGGEQLKSRDVEFDIENKISQGVCEFKFDDSFDNGNSGVPNFSQPFVLSSEITFADGVSSSCPIFWNIKSESVQSLGGGGSGGMDATVSIEFRIQDEQYRTLDVRSFVLDASTRIGVAADSLGSRRDDEFSSSGSMELSGEIVSLKEGAIQISAKSETEVIYTQDRVIEKIDYKETLKFSDFITVGVVRGATETVFDPFQEINNLEYYINGERVTRDQYEALGLDSPESDEILVQEGSDSNQSYPFPNSGSF